MDSIVDAFFPMLDFIEAESDELDDYLADPLQASRQQLVLASGTKRHRWFSRSPVVRRRHSRRQLMLSATDPLFDRDRCFSALPPTESWWWR